MNPARSLGPALVTGELTDLWLYLLAPVIGAAAAVLLYSRFREASRWPASFGRASVPTRAALAPEAIRDDPTVDRGGGP